MANTREYCPTTAIGVAVGASSTSITPSIKNRRRLELYTLGPVNVWLGQGKPAVVGKGIVLLAEGASSYTWDEQCNLVTSEIFGITEDGSIQDVHGQEYE